MVCFSRVKGYMDIEPLEAVGMKPSLNSQLYLLFQMDTKVKRTKIIETKGHITYTWEELTSQCRFTIDPTVDAVLTVFLMDHSTTPVPKMIGKGKVDLLKLLADNHKPEVRVELNKPSYMGVVVLEITFHLTVPMVPVRQSPQAGLSSVDPNINRPVPPIPSLDPVANKPKRAQTSSLNDVFVSPDYKPDSPTIGKIVNKFKKTMKKPVKAIKQHNRTKSGSWLEEEPSVVEIKPTKPLPRVPPKTKTLTTSSDDIDNSYFSKPEIITNSDDEEDDDEDDTITLPSIKNLNITVSNNDISVEEYERRAKEKIQIAKKENEKRVTLSPQSVAMFNRLQNGVYRKDDFTIDAGDSYYKGNGTWERGCLRDSMKVGEPPKLPPKIPIGMTKEEFFSTHRNDYINYLKSVTTM